MDNSLHQVGIPSEIPAAIGAGNSQGRGRGRKQALGRASALVHAQHVPGSRRATALGRTSPSPVQTRRRKATINNPEPKPPPQFINQPPDSLNSNPQGESGESRSAVPQNSPPINFNQLTLGAAAVPVNPAAIDTTNPAAIDAYLLEWNGRSSEVLDSCYGDNSEAAERRSGGDQASGQQRRHPCGWRYR